MYRTGYSVDYLPYLKIDGLNYRAVGINIKSSFGIGKIANKEVSSECLRLDMNLSKSLISRDNFNLRLNSVLQGIIIEQIIMILPDIIIIKSPLIAPIKRILVRNSD